MLLVAAWLDTNEGDTVGRSRFARRRSTSTIQQRSEQDLNYKAENSHERAYRRTWSWCMVASPPTAPVGKPSLTFCRVTATRKSVAQPPETSYADDQKYTKAAIDAMGGPVVLVSHSCGGSIITEADVSSKRWQALVYIAAFALDEGESCASIERAPAASVRQAFKPDTQRALVDRRGDIARLTSAAEIHSTR